MPTASFILAQKHFLLQKTDAIVHCVRYELSQRVVRWILVLCSMQVNSKLLIFGSAYSLDVEVPHAASIPDGLGVYSLLLSQSPRIGKLCREPERWVVAKSSRLGLLIIGVPRTGPAR